MAKKKPARHAKAEAGETKKKVAAKPAKQHVPMSWGSQAFLHSLGVVGYIIFVAFLMVNGQTLFGNIDNSILGPIAMLLLFTLSAAVMGLLVFGRPAMLYMDGKKKEAMEFVAATVGFLFIEALVVFIALALVSA